MRHAGVLVALALVAGASEHVNAQSTVETTPVLTSGDTLRVWAPTVKLDGAMGVLARLTAMELVLAGQSAGPGMPQREYGIPMSTVQRIDVLQPGKRRSKTRIFTGVVLGAGVGALIGAPMGRILECGGACDEVGSTQPMLSPWYGGTIGAGVFGLIGGVAASISRPKWRSVTFTVR